MVNNVLSEVINSMSNIYGWWTKGHLRIESSSDILLSIYFIHHHHKGYKLHYTLGKNKFVFSKENMTIVDSTHIAKSWLRVADLEFLSKYFSEQVL